MDRVNHEGSVSLVYTDLGKNTCQVSGYLGADSKVLVPKYYDDCLVVSIGDYAFKGATSLTKIQVDNYNKMYSSIEGVLFNKDQTTLIIYQLLKVKLLIQYLIV